MEVNSINSAYGSAKRCAQLDWDHWEHPSRSLKRICAENGPSLHSLQNATSQSISDTSYWSTTLGNARAAEFACNDWFGASVDQQEGLFSWPENMLTGDHIDAIYMETQMESWDNQEAFLPATQTGLGYDFGFDFEINDAVVEVQMEQSGDPTGGQSLGLVGAEETTGEVLTPELDSEPPQNMDCSILTDEMLSQNLEYSSEATDAESTHSAEYVHYDTCFGAIVVNATSSCSNKGNSAVPVDTTVFGDMVRLTCKETNKYLGIITLSSLSRILEEFNVKFVASIVRSQSKKREKSKIADRRECLVRIVIYGLKSDRFTVGGILSDAEIYLQQPSAEECDRDTEYLNPHYLVRPGSGMPKLGHLSLSSDSRTSQAQDTLDEVRKNQFMQLFDCANTGDDLDQITPSARLSSTLKRHQLSALSMMLEKECGIIENPQFPPIWSKSSSLDNIARYRHCATGRYESIPTPVYGGILADEMGLGKTLSALALVCSGLDLTGNLKDPVESGLQSQVTLIVTPKSTIHGWQQQIKRHIHSDQIRVVLYHGSNRQQKAQAFKDVDIVLTTYETLRADWSGNGALYSERWCRVILDEAHHIRNRSSQVFKASCDIKTQYRWCLTGTPIQNSLDDYGSLLSFIGVHSLNTKNLFDHWISSPIKAGQLAAMARLRAIIKATCIRRTKNAMQQSLSLPNRDERVETVYFQESDLEIYDFFKRKTMAMASKSAIGSYRTTELNESTEGNILAMITSLRLICNHGKDLLPTRVLQYWEAADKVSMDWETMQSQKNLCSLCNVPVAGLILESDGPSLCSDCAEQEGSPSNEEMTGSDLLISVDSDHNSFSERPVASHIKVSAKVESLLRNLRVEQATRGNSGSEAVVKSVIFSYWTKMLDLIQQALKSDGFGFQRIDGKSSLAARGRALTQFNEDPKCTVMLASIGSAGEGIDLTVASCVHLVEPQWNPMAEAQAVDRIHRIGQTRDVKVTRYIMKDSVEEYVQWVQQDKLKLINRSFESTEISMAQIQNERLERLQRSLV